jgi:hypothetical protein
MNEKIARAKNRSARAMLEITTIGNEIILFLASSEKKGTSMNMNLIYDNAKYTHILYSSKC